MTWVEDAQRSWAEHRNAERARDAAMASRTVDYVTRLYDRLHLAQSTPQPVVEGGAVRVRVPLDDAVRDRLQSVGVTAVELCADVDPQGMGVPEVHGWLRVEDGTPGGVWVDRGTVETLADLGRALDPEVVNVGPEPERQSEGELLLTVMQAIVRDVVVAELEGRYGGGPA